jgi:hypothetical protein
MRRNRKDSLKYKSEILLAGKKRRNSYSTAEQMIELEIAIRDQAMINSKKFYYIHRKCKNCGSYSKKFSIDGTCFNCYGR